MGEDQMEKVDISSDVLLNGSQKNTSKSFCFGLTSILLFLSSLIIQYIISLPAFNFGDDIIYFFILFLSTYSAGLILGIIGTYTSKKGDKLNNANRNETFGYFLPRLGLTFNLAGILVWLLLYVDLQSREYLVDFVYPIIITVVIFPACYYLIKFLYEKRKWGNVSIIFIIGGIILGITIPSMRLIRAYLSSFLILEFEIKEVYNIFIYSLMIGEYIAYLLFIGMPFIIIGINQLKSPRPKGRGFLRVR